MSKAAWGSFEKNETQYFIRSYEIGVLFMPSFLLQDDLNNYFETEPDADTKFLIPYDLPPQKYGPNGNFKTLHVDLIYI